MKHLLLIILLCSISVNIRAFSSELSCETDETTSEHLTRISEGYANRINKHLLRISSEEKVIDLADEAPFDVELAGVSYYYCEYFKSTQMHHVIKEDHDIYTGVLVSQETGKVLKAGHSVYFSNDKTKYFSARQPSGLDGEEWFVYDNKGNKIWQGFSGISIIHPELKVEYFVVTLDRPKWNNKGELTASARCGYDFENKKKTTQVKLTKLNSEWQWLPELECPDS